MPQTTASLAEMVEKGVLKVCVLDTRWVTQLMQPACSHEMYTIWKTMSSRAGTDSFPARFQIDWQPSIAFKASTLAALQVGLVACVCRVSSFVQRKAQAVSFPSMADLSASHLRLRAVANVFIIHS